MMQGNRPMIGDSLRQSLAATPHGAAGEGLITVRSEYSVAETITREELT